MKIKEIQIGMKVVPSQNTVYKPNKLIPTLEAVMFDIYPYLIVSDIHQDLVSGRSLSYKLSTPDGKYTDLYFHEDFDAYTGIE